MTSKMLVSNQTLRSSHPSVTILLYLACNKLEIDPGLCTIVATNFTTQVSALSFPAFQCYSEKVKLPMKSWTLVIWLDSSSELPISSDPMKPLRVLGPLFQCGPKILAEIIVTIKDHMAFTTPSNTTEAKHRKDGDPSLAQGLRPGNKISALELHTSNSTVVALAGEFDSMQRL